MIADAEVASLCAAIYKPAAVVSGFDHFDAGLDDGVCWALKKVDGFDVVIFRGSVTFQDWLRDLYVLPFGQFAPLLTRIGHVHAGFFLGMEHVWSDLRPLLTQPVIVAGHSLGGARACILTALMVADGAPPVRRVTFGEPKTGLLDYAQFVKDVPAAPYRNGDAVHHDQVTDLPPSFPPLQIVHPNPIQPVCCKPDGSEFEQLGVFAWHHIPLYETAVAVFEQQEKAA
jgi:hypothetical protein